MERNSMRHMASARLNSKAPVAEPTGEFDRFSCEIRANVTESCAAHGVCAPEGQGACYRARR